MQTKTNRATAHDIERLAQELITRNARSPDEIDGIVGHLHPDDAHAVGCRAQLLLMEAAEADSKHADELQILVRLARATGCPKGQAVIPWLESRGLIERVDDQFALTPKGGTLLKVLTPTA